MFTNSLCHLCGPGQPRRFSDFVIYFCGIWAFSSSRKHCLGTVILITAAAKLFAYQDSIRNSLQQSDLSWGWRDLVTLTDLGVRHSDCDNISRSPALIHNNHTNAQQYSDRRLLHHLQTAVYLQSMTLCICMSHSDWFLDWQSMALNRRKQFRCFHLITAITSLEECQTCRGHMLRY